MKPSTAEFHRKVLPRFWTGQTGRALRGDHLSQAVALYLFTGPEATRVGIYPLAIPTLAHYLGSSIEGATKALERVCQLGVAVYDEEEELVWVPNMAQVQIGERLRPKDNQIAGIMRGLEPFKRHGFYEQFLERYSECFSLEIKAAPCKPLASPFRGSTQAPLKPEAEAVTVAVAEAEAEAEQTPARPIRLAEPVGLEGKPALDSDSTHALDCTDGGDCWCSEEGEKQGMLLRMSVAGPGVGANGPEKTPQPVGERGPVPDRDSRDASHARAPEVTAGGRSAKPEPELRKPSKTVDEAELRRLEGSFKAIGVRVDAVRQALSSTRAGGKIADSVWLGVLSKWTNYAAWAVVAGSESYLDRGYATEGKQEGYLLGIIIGKVKEAKAKGRSRAGSAPCPTEAEWAQQPVGRQQI